MRMFDHHSKADASVETGERSHWTGEVSGAFADLGTFLPLVIGLLVLGRFDPTGLLLGFGIFAVLTGLIYRLPIPVQPMKVVAALAIAGGMSASALMASGLLLGLALLVLGATGLIDRLHRLVPRTVLFGIQLGLGLHLLMAGIALAADALALALVIVLILSLLLAAGLRAIACILILATGIAWSLASGSAVLPDMSLGFHLPGFGLPDWQGMREAAEGAFLPQLAMTVTNAVLLTAVLAREYFPKTGERVSARRLALSSGALNLALAPFGVMPMCHGAGGLAAQYRHGARRGLAPVIFGSACLALGLFAGPQALDWLLLVPLPVVAALLAIAGLQLIEPRRFVQVSRSCLVIIGLTALVSLTVNVAAGLAAGIVAELLRSAMSRRLRRFPPPWSGKTP